MGEPTRKELEAENLLLSAEVREAFSDGFWVGMDAPAELPKNYVDKAFAERKQKPDSGSPAPHDRDCCCDKCEAECVAFTADSSPKRTCEFNGGTCPNEAVCEASLGNGTVWYACCDSHCSYMRREKATFREIETVDEKGQTP